MIPLKEYDALRAKAAPPSEREQSSQVAPGAALTRIDYELRIEGAQASGRATAIVDILREGWFKVPLPAALHVREARLAGKLALIAEGAAIFSKQGRHVLELELAAPVTLSGGEERITLPASGSGVTHVALTINRPGIEVTASGGAVSPAVPNGNRWLIHARGDAPLSLSWRRKTVEPQLHSREEQPLRQRGRIVEWLSLGEDSTTIAVEVTLEVAQGAARVARLAVPDSVTVNQIQGAGVMDWERKGGEVLVTFLEPVPKQAQFVVQAEARLPRDGAMNLPLLRLLDVEREAGGVVVEAVGAAETRNPALQGLERTDLSELGTPSGLTRQSAASVEAFRYVPGAGGARSLKIEVARYTPQATLTAVVDEARYQALMSADGKILVRARLAVRNNQRNFLKLTIPTGAALWSALVEGRAARPGLGPQESLLLPLPKAISGQEPPLFAVEVTYLVKGEAWAAERGRVTLTLPRLDLPVGRSAVELFYPPRFRVSAEPGLFRDAEFWPPSSAALLAVVPPAAASQSPPAQTANRSTAAFNTQVLADQFRLKRQVRLPQGAALGIAFPAFGPMLFLEAELTGDSRDARLEFSYAKEGRRGEDR